jgi:hypothetical protein
MDGRQQRLGQKDYQAGENPAKPGQPLRPVVIAQQKGADDRHHSSNLKLVIGILIG